MAGREPDRSPSGQRDAGSPDRASADPRPDPRPEDAVECDGAEREKAETEIAAGDVADDLADFA